MKFVARKSNNIQEDIKRNWSSWNFGEEGFEGTKEDLIELLNETKENESSCWISGFDIWVESVDYDCNSVYANDFEFRELYDGYWVAVDNVNSPDGLSCISLNSDNVEDAIKEANNRTDYFGDGDSFDADDYELIFSNEDIHVFVRK